jgi:hypothetical protein
MAVRASAESWILTRMAPPIRILSKPSSILEQRDPKNARLFF